MSPVRIMLVDDHRLIIDGIRALLAERKDIVVVNEASNGIEALAKLKRTAADIVLMDVDMPLLNGWDAASEITKKFPGTKVIALTTYDEKTMVQKMLQAGAKGYILKNIKKEELIEAIKKVYAGETFYSSEILLTLAKPSLEESLFKETSPLLQQLSSREMQILKLVANGYSSKEIADQLFLSVKTVETHRSHIMHKLQLKNLADLIRFAIRNGLTEK